MKILSIYSASVAGAMTGTSRVNFSVRLDFDAVAGARVYYIIPQRIGKSHIVSIDYERAQNFTNISGITGYDTNEYNLRFAIIAVG